MTTTASAALQHLQALGFSEYEGRAYITLLERGPLTGYQLARASSVPRPNIYPVLDRLEQRGVVARIHVKDALKYAALPASEMLARLSRSVESHLKNAELALSELETGPQGEYVWNIVGRDSVLGRAEALVNGSEQQLLAALWSAESRQLAPAFERASQRGVQIITLCIQGCSEECGGCRGKIYRYPTADGREARWLVLVADARELLVAQAHDDGTDGAVTTLKVFVAVAAHYVKNTIALAEVSRSLGPDGIGSLDADARDALRAAGLAAPAWDQATGRPDDAA
jgi:sugar-specific transcriptional regulator TrmB